MSVGGTVVFLAGCVVSFLLSDNSNKTNKNNISANPTKKQIREQREQEGFNRCDRKNTELEKEYNNYLFLHNNYQKVCLYSNKQRLNHIVPIANKHSR